MRQLFGTDGIRGVAGEFPLDRATASALGVALARWIGEKHLSPEVVIGMDTRESSRWIAEYVAGGLAQRRRGGAVRGLDHHSRAGATSPRRGRSRRG